MTIKAQIEVPDRASAQMRDAARLVRHADPSKRRYHVVDIFGPTIQGEGPDAGRPCHFVRLGGCDYRCSWCDTMEAVDPAQVRERAVRMTAEQITDDLEARDGAARLVILSGGNPALHPGAPLVKRLHRRGFEVAVETQGSRWRPWLSTVNRLVVSPKAPSSGMCTAYHHQQFHEFMRKTAAAFSLRPDAVALKIVVFDERDLEWAAAVHLALPLWPFYLSAGTDQDVPGIDGLTTADAVKQTVAARYRWLCERVAAEPALARARVLPQLHVIAWGQEASR